MDDSEIEKVLTAFGLNPQAFPIYYPMGPQPFQLDGVASGAQGAVAMLSHSLPNPPHILMGIRVSNVYDLPADADADDIANYTAMKQFVDGDQTLYIDLAQQNILANPTYQTHVTGRADGQHWFPFPAPFPMAGGNNVSLTVTRLTSYPQLVGEDVTPVCRATLVAAVLRGGSSTQPVRRVHR